MPHLPRHGSLLVVSGPSGAGKSTVCQRILAATARLRFSVSCTTRAPRPGEVDGRDYHFLSVDRFRARLAAGAFLEHATVHGNLYGTLRDEVLGHLDAGTDVLLDIDVQGALQIRANAAAQPWAASLAFIFIAPPSLTELERRLRGRGTDDDATIARRLANARGELACWEKYDYLLVNDTVDQAVADLRTLIAARRLSTHTWRAQPPWEA